MLSGKKYNFHPPPPVVTCLRFVHFHMSSGWCKKLLLFQHWTKEKKGIRNSYVLLLFFLSLLRTIIWSVFYIHYHFSFRPWRKSRKQAVHSRAVEWIALGIGWWQADGVHDVACEELWFWRLFKIVSKCQADCS